MNVYILEENYNLSKKTNSLFKPIKYKVNGECWECISHSVNNSGYPRVYRNGKKEFIHRYVYQLYNGNIPNKMEIMHICDNRICINP